MIYNFKHKSFICHEKYVLIVKITEEDSLSWDVDRRAEVVIQPFLER